MKSVDTYQIKQWVIIFVSVLCLAACMSTTNPTPDYIQPQEISYDEYGNRNAGLVDVVFTDPPMFEITPQTVERYNQLIELYGDYPQFVPKLTKNLGITKKQDSDNYLMSRQAMVYFQDLKDIQRMQIKLNKED